MKRAYRTLLVTILLSSLISSTVAIAQTIPSKPTILALERRGGSYDTRTGYSHKPWLIALGFNANYSIPIDNQFNRIESGVGYELNFNYAVAPSVSLRFAYGRSGVKNAEPRNLYPSSPIYFKATTPPMPDNLSYHANREEIETERYFISLQFTRSPRVLARNKSLLYMYAGLGQISNHIESYGTFYDNSTDATYSAKYNHTENNLAFTFGLGTVMMLSKQIGLDFQVSSDLIDNSEYRNYGIGHALPSYEGTLDIKLGLVAFH